MARTGGAASDGSAAAVEATTVWLKFLPALALARLSAFSVMGPLLDRQKMSSEAMKLRA